MSVQSVFAILDPLTGAPFWAAYHAMGPGDQAIAQGELQLDAWFCGWTPGPDTWTAPPPPVVIVPPPYEPPPWTPPVVAVPEPATWLMLTIAFATIGMLAERRSTLKPVGKGRQAGRLRRRQ